jgi:DNA repair exonuclease SbcCD ATPase subunit
MRISHVLLRNICQHRQREFDLSPGLNVFLGHNGSGKSNALKAIYAAVTNDWRRNAGPKETNIYQLAAANEPSAVEVTFEHHGAEYRVTRDLPTGQALKIPGETKMITRDALVNQQLMQILGVTPEILDNYIFVDQWAMFDFLTATDTERAKAFARLFGTLAAEEAWKTLGDKLNTIEVPQILADLEGQRDGLQQAQVRIDTLSQQLSRYANLPERPDSNSVDRQAVRDAHRRAGLAKDIVQCEERIAAATREHKAVSEERTQFQSDLEALTVARQGNQSSLDSARAALVNWNTLRTVQEARARLETQLEKHRSEEASHPKPNRCGNYVSDLDVDYNNRHDFLKGEIARAERFVRSFDSSAGCAECPTCFTPVANLQQAVDEAKAALPEMKKEYEEKHRWIDYSREIDRREREWITWLNSWKPRLAELEQQLAGLQTIERPVHDESVLNKVVTDARELEEAIQGTQKEIKAIDRQIGELAGGLDIERKALARYKAEISALVMVSPEALVTIEQRLAEEAQAFQDRARLRGELETERRYHQAFQDSITMLEGQRAEAERLKLLTQHLGEMRSVLHRDNLPRIVAQHFLRELQVETNEFLGLFEAPFRVEADDNLSFRALFHDGNNQPAARLSGGEKVVLALAFRLSVNSMFAQDVGLLCLDEPTVGLDEHNLGCLQTAMERLREITRARGLQVIMVTHERSLGHLFDKVIDFSEPA